MRERITYPQDIFEHGRFFFNAPILFDESVISKKWNEEAVKVLSAYRDEVKKIEAPSAEIAKTTLDSVAGNLGIGTGKVLQALRVALTGQGSGPDLMLTIEILGSEETVSRLDYALQNIQLKK
jgi:glutamyl-tRNA synthetase